MSIGKQYHVPDFDAVLDRAIAAGVEKVVLTGMSLSDVHFNLDIVKSHPSQCSMTVGVHPYHAAEAEAEGYLEDLFKQVRQLSHDNVISAFGELGLDYDHLEHASKEVQLRTFRRQLDMFIEHEFDLPLFLHCRAAFNDFVSTIEPYLSQLPRRGVVHSFVGDTSQMQKLVEMGFDISVNGFSFRDPEALEMVRNISLQKLQIETDAPWGVIPPSSEVATRYLKNAKPLPPSKKKDKFELGMMVKDRNESCTIERVAMVVAGLKGITLQEVADAAWKNSAAMFKPQADI
ncbi:hypothetical protein LTS08_007271 [Lithohypha guttulata]|nr:hypothetical protein LTS08_007271 [Lithohypha guttulata]